MADLSNIPRAYRRTLATGLAAVRREIDTYRNWSDDALRAHADVIRARCAAASPDAAACTDLEWVIDPIALAAVAAERALGLAPYDEQILGALAIALGALAEVRTGEGKTLLATMPAVAFALAGRSVHVMTANEYLATRDATWMAPVYGFLGCTTSATTADMSVPQRQAAYAADICYGTASQFGFDYLADRLVSAATDQAQGPLSVAIVDEADALLLDDARTPLIVSGPPGPASSIERVAAFVAGLDPAAVDVELEHRTAMLNDLGFDLAEAAFDTVLTDDPALLGEVYAALRARFCYHRDKDYLVDGDQAVIVDESTGRTQADRRWQHGLHEAIEAKEGLPVRLPSVTLGSITIPAYLAMYDHVGAMSGTALSDKAEFGDTYGLHVIPIPTHKPSARIDGEDLLFVSRAAKFAALCAAVVERTDRGQPVLVGAPTVADAEEISAALADAGVDHALLTARFPDREAGIVADAGRPGQVTVATNMAGRGVDIVLGGAVPDTADEAAATAHATARAAVVAAGGLAVLATARHASRRVDDQLRGRAGRQGEPGFTQFYLSLDDELLAIFANQTTRSMIAHAATDPAKPVAHRLVSKLVATAQEKLESVHEEARRTTNDFATAAIAQQEVVYAWRDELLRTDPHTAVVRTLTTAFAARLERVDRDGTPTYVATDAAMATEATGALERDEATEKARDAMVDEPVIAMTDVPAVEVPFGAVWCSFTDDLAVDWFDDEAAQLLAAGDTAGLAARCFDAFMTRNAHVGTDLAGPLRDMFRAKLDALWVQHLVTLEAIKDAVRLRAAGQRDPRREFVTDASAAFEEMCTEFLTGAGRLVSCGLLQTTPPA